MEYIYAKSENYEDFASGRVLYSESGITNFPVKLAVESLGRCLELIEKKENVHVYDPCCGGGYLLTVLGFLCAAQIGQLTGSDISETSVELANKNLSLLTTQGMEKRKAELKKMIATYNKDSHKEALVSAGKLRKMSSDVADTKVFQADVFGPISLETQPDIIMTDLPYGELVEWKTEQSVEDPASRFLDCMGDLCTDATIVGIWMDKKQKISSERFERIKKINVGKRRFEIYHKIK